jgi:hypothetical protein
MTTHANFQYVAHWQTDLPDENEAVLAFWRNEKAIGDETQARARLKEIVVHARSEDGEVAGVCTAVAMTLPRLGQPLYYYRTFVGEKWRKSRLVVLLLKRAFELLEGYAVKNGYPCIGVVIELENARFAEAGRMPVWPDVDFVYIGKSQRGFDLRVRYFRGATLK